MNMITEQELHPSLKNKINKIETIEKNETKNEELKLIKKEIDSLKSRVDNGKNDLYSAIIDKKVTPKSKDFNALVQGVKDIVLIDTEQNKKYESQINQLKNDKSNLEKKVASIKPAKGNAKSYQVSENATFTNESGELQKGSLKVTSILDITPSDKAQQFRTGIYGTINVAPITPELIKNIGFNIYRKQEFNVESKCISKRSSKEWGFTCDFEPRFIMILNKWYSFNNEIHVGNGEASGIDSDSDALGSQFIDLYANCNGNNITISMHNAWKRDSIITNSIKITVLDIDGF